MGFHRIRRDVVVGRGAENFMRAAEGVRTWKTHTGRGLSVFPKDPPKVGQTVVVTLGTRWIGLAVPCRVVATFDEPRRYGFVYVTLPGHPECGEESFVVTHDQDDEVRFHISALSRPATLLTRCAGPLGRVGQWVATESYGRRLRHFVQREP